MSTIRVPSGDFSYDTSKLLGEGSFGTLVFTGFHRNVGAVAVKRVQKYYLQDELDILRWEVELMNAASDHPNILRCICTTTNDDYLFIATELCNGALDDYFNGKYEGPRFQSEREILRQVTRGLAHLHDLKIIHRDIKPGNLLIFVPPDETKKPQMKLADFNISKMLEKELFGEITSPTNPSGSRGWMAPEVYESNRFDFKGDVWALGLIFGYSLSEGKHPFGDDPDFRITRIKRNEPMLLVKTDLKKVYRNGGAFELIKSMLMAESKDRPSVTDVLKDPFILLRKDEVRTAQFLDLCKSFRDSITNDKIAQFKKLVSDETVDVNAITMSRDKIEMSPIHFLCRDFDYRDKHFMELVKDLILNGADINVKVNARFFRSQLKTGMTPLHLLFFLQRYEKMNNMLDIVQLFLTNGANANATDVSGCTPLHYLCKYYKNYNLTDIAKLLIEYGADVDAKDRTGNTPLFYVYKFWRPRFDERSFKSFVFFFVEMGAADIDATDEDGNKLYT